MYTRGTPTTANTACPSRMQTQNTPHACSLAQGPAFDSAWLPNEHRARVMPAKAFWSLHTGVGIIVNSPTPVAPSPPRLLFFSPGAAQGAFELLRLARGGAKTPLRRGAMPSPPLMLPSPEAPSPGAELAAALLLEFAQQGSARSPEPCQALAVPARPLPDAPPTAALMSPAALAKRSPSTRKAITPTAAVLTPLRSVVAALKTPLRSALKCKQSPAAPTPVASTTQKSTRRVRFAAERGSRASGSTGDATLRHCGFVNSPWRAPLGLFQTAGRRSIGCGSASPKSGGSASARLLCACFGTRSVTVWLQSLAQKGERL